MDQGLNWDLASAINGLAGRVPILDRLGIFAANDLIFLLVLSLLVWWFLPLAGDAGKHAALTAAAAVVAGLVLSVVIGHVVDVPRPFVVHQVHLLVHHAADSSFPSDHSTAAFSVAGTGLARRMPIRWIVLLGAVLIALARVYVGVHYPADVVGGAMIGVALALLFLRLDAWLARPSGLAIDLARRVHHHSRSKGSGQVQGAAAARRIDRL